VGENLYAKRVLWVYSYHTSTNKQYLIVEVWAVELRSAVRDNCIAKRTTIVEAANRVTRTAEKCNC